MTEERLIHLCRKQDRNGQKVLYERYEEAMFRLCYRYVRDQQEAEDVLCKGFLKVLQHFEKFQTRGVGSLRKWIVKIMVNECLMFLRKKRFEFVSDDIVLTLPATVRTDSDLEAEDLYAMVRALPIGYRTVFNLYAIEGYTHPEIAKKLGISPGTSKSQLSKARAQLQKMLAKNENYHESEYRQSV